MKVGEIGLVLVLFSIYLLVPSFPDFFGLKTAFSPYAGLIFLIGLLGILMGKKVI